VNPGRRLPGCWPELVVFAYGLWATSPLWRAGERVFAGKFSSDNAVSAWFYSTVAHGVRRGADLQHLTDFNWPRPHPRTVEFPGITEALLAAPLTWLLPWPLSWGASQSLAVLTAGLGAGLLARALGCRGVGVVTAGLLGVLARPVWKDLVMARMNAVWIGLAIAALALTVAATRTGGPVRVVAAAVLGAVAAMVYPPYLVILVPAGLALVGAELPRAGWRGGARLALCVIGALAVAGPELLRLLDARAAVVDCAQLGCPEIYSRLTAIDLVRRWPEPVQGLSLPGVPAGAWALAPLALLGPRRRAVPLLALVGALLLLALGPCPQLSEGVPLDWRAWGPLASGLPAVWCAAWPINDFGRFATAAALLAAALGGIGIEALGRLRWVGPPLALAAATAAIGQAQFTVLSEVLSPDKWHAVSAPLATRALTGSGPIADLPFDRKGQFLAAITAPGVPRINPLRPEDPPPTGDPFIVWLYALNDGGSLPSPPAPELIRRSGVEWVFFDPTRCVGRPDVRERCQRTLPQALKEALGAPEVTAGGLGWRVGQD